MVRSIGRILLAAVSFLCAAASAAPAQTLTLVRDAEIEEHLRAIADPLLEAAGLVPRDVALVIVRDERLNAFVAGGQKLFVHTGLIQRTETPEQLAGVIAHEVGHIAGGHLARQMQAREQALAQMAIGTVLGLAAAAAGAPELGTAIVAGGATVAERGILAFTRAQEQAADLAAVSYLARIGLPPSGLIEFLRIVETRDLRITPEGDVYRRTHPLSRDRIAYLEAQEANSPLRGRTLGPARAAAHERVRAKLDGFLSDPETVLARWSGDSFAARYARAAALHRMGDVARAVALARELVAERPKDAYVHELLGQILYENGRFAEAVAAYRTALRLAPQAALIRLALARALLELPDEQGVSEAAALAREVVRAEPRDIVALRTLGIAEGRLGRLGPASLALAEAALVARDKRTAELHLARARRLLRPDEPGYRDLLDLERAIAALPEPRAGPSGRR